MAPTTPHPTTLHPTTSGVLPVDAAGEALLEPDAPAAGGEVVGDPLLSTVRTAVEKVAG